ncbi:MAG: hypothetical protein EPO26_03840 [Chloroflexota bacterium]|nr:MAG: hypothetical protein EPO26_03840 [Chloroflexota bacterium]
MSRFLVLAHTAIASFALLSLEVAAPRILAPALGASLYTWTATLGLVLSGLAIGAWVGGTLPRGMSPVFGLSGSLALGACLMCVSVAVADHVTEMGWWRDTPILARLFTVDAVALLPASIVLGAVIPLAAAATVRTADGVGISIGAIYAASTMGGLAGTFVSGFWLVPTIGARETVAVGAAIALAVAVAGAFTAGSRRLVAAIAACAVVGGVSAVDAIRRTPCDYETAYYCVRIDEQDVDAGAGPTLTLWLDHLSHSRISLFDPKRLSFSYLRAYGDLTAVVARDNPNFRALVVGAGAYGFPRYIEDVYPSAIVYAIEIDPVLTEISHRRFGLRRDTRIITRHGDARAVLSDWTGVDAFDIVYADAFNDLAMPWHLTTIEFLRVLKARMAPNAMYVSNVIDQPRRHGAIARSFVATIATVFPYTYALRWGPPESTRIETLVIVGSGRPIDFGPFDRVETIPEIPGARFGSARVEEIERAAGDPDAVRLTDDYAPIDQLVAPLYVLRD